MDDVYPIQFLYFWLFGHILDSSTISEKEMMQVRMRIYKYKCWQHCCCYLVVEAAVVLVAVSMYGAEEAAAPAGEPGQPHLLLARLTPVLLLLPLLIPAVPGVTGGGRGGSGPEDGVGWVLGRGGAGGRDHGHGGLPGLEGGRGHHLLLAAQAGQTRTLGRAWNRIHLKQSNQKYWWGL